jgi:hypothetical protein
MKPISGKVTAATVAASMTAIVSGIVSPHLFQYGTPSDVIGLANAGVAAVVTFASGYLARHGIDAGALAKDTVAVAADLGVPYSAISEADEVLAYVDPTPAPSAPVYVPAVPAVPAVAQPLAGPVGDPAA